MPPHPLLWPLSPQFAAVRGVQPQVPGVEPVAPLQVMFEKPPPVLHGHARSCPPGPPEKAEFGAFEHTLPTPPVAA